MNRKRWNTIRQRGMCTNIFTGRLSQSEIQALDSLVYYTNMMGVELDNHTRTPRSTDQCSVMLAEAQVLILASSLRCATSAASRITSHRIRNAGSCFASIRDWFPAAHVLHTFWQPSATSEAITCSHSMCMY